MKMSANTALIQYFTRSPNNGSKARKIIKFLKVEREEIKLLTITYAYRKSNR